VKVALVHDWLTGMRGGERVLERLCRLFPGAPIHTLVWARGALSPEIESHPIRVSRIQRLPGAARRYRWCLPFFPRAIEAFDLSGFDAVISTSHCVAKGARTPPGTFHLGYIFTPMRYVWDLQEQYFPPGRYPWPLSSYIRRTCDRLRAWDVATAGRPDALLANSHHVAERIARHWGREAEVLYPPVDVSRFTAPRTPEDFYLLAGALVPYKRAELAIAACRRLGRKLVIAGAGPEEHRLRSAAEEGRRAGGEAVTFLGRVSDAEIARLYASARALLFPGEEDFGIVPVEALASGCPVVAFGRGGALETIGLGAHAQTLARMRRGEAVRAPGGVLFGGQTAESLCEAIRLLEQTEGDPARAHDPAALRALAAPFADAEFDRRFLAAFERAHAAWLGKR
jgi:glycosyltransferase involved in cell wall biosynthesis